MSAFAEGTSMEHGGDGPGVVGGFLFDGSIEGLAVEKEAEARNRSERSGGQDLDVKGMEPQALSELRLVRARGSTRR